MRLPLRALLALALGLACALALACGEEREGLISSSRAEDIKQTLDRIDEDVTTGRCDGALTDHLAALRRDVDDLPGTVDRDLRRRLREGVDYLEQRAPEECGAGTETETQPETIPETVETVPPETVPTVPPETTPTTPPETTPTTPPETTPPETTPPETTPPDSGGEQAPLSDQTGEAVP